MNRLPASQRYKRHTGRWKRYEKQRPWPHICADRRQIHRTHRSRRRPQEALLPIHRDRRLHPTARPAGLPALRPEDRDPIPRLRAVTAAVPGREDPDTTTAPNSSPASTGTSLTRESAISTSGQPPPDSTEKWSVRTGSTPKSSTRLLDGVIEDDTGLFNQKLKEWEDYYNYHRPHGGLGGQTPYERLLQKTKAQPVTGHRQSAQLAANPRTSSAQTCPLSGRNPVGPFAAFIQQRIRHAYRRQRPAWLKAFGLATVFPKRGESGRRRVNRS